MGASGYTHNPHMEQQQSGSEPNKQDAMIISSVDIVWAMMWLFAHHHAEMKIEPSHMHIMIGCIWQQWSVNESIDSLQHPQCHKTLLGVSGSTGACLSSSTAYETCHGVRASQNDSALASVFTSVTSGKMKCISVL